MVDVKLKPRLIDANKLIPVIARYVNENNHVNDTSYDAYWNVIHWMKEQETAYDIDEVVKALERGSRLRIEHQCEPDYIIRLDKAIEIVKGGVE